MDYESMWNELKDLLKVGNHRSSRQSPLDLMDRIHNKYTTIAVKKPLTASEMGKIGGSSTTEAKSSASRENGKLGGRPKKDKPK